MPIKWLEDLGWNPNLNTFTNLRSDVRSGRLSVSRAPKQKPRIPIAPVAALANSPASNPPVMVGGRDDLKRFVEYYGVPTAKKWLDELVSEFGVFYNSVS